MSNILLVSGHTNLISSRVNKEIINSLQKTNLNIRVHELDSLYNNSFYLDVEKEHRILENTDVIVLQFPFYWYSMPSIMQLWMEQVFTPDFAYGNAFKLKEKSLISSLTTGSTQEIVDNMGGIEVFLKPIIETCLFTGMDYKGHVVTYGIKPATQNVKVLAHNHSKQLVEVLR